MLECIRDDFFDDFFDDFLVPACQSHEFHEFQRSKELLRRAQQHGLANAILDELDRERQELRCSVAETQSCLAGGKGNEGQFRQCGNENRAKEQQAVTRI